MPAASATRAASGAAYDGPVDEAHRAGSDTFTTPLTRAGLAEYLNCDRSALSRELSRMQHDGLIETWRSSFKLLDKDRLKNA